MYDANPALRTRPNLDHQIIARSRLVGARELGESASQQTALRGWKDDGTLERLQGAVTELYHVINTAVQNDQGLLGEGLRRAAELLQLNIRHVVSGTIETKTLTDNMPLRGGLAPWQARKIRLFIDAHLDSVIRVSALATQVDLSRYHFSRAFRQSFGDSPHAYVMRRRIERAQGLMLTSVVPLGQIAVECGLADQAHLTKLFRRLVGESPGVWRRARATFV